ncbi:MAG TPA: response regulator, partial [Syntrophales bacterium]
RVVVEVLSAIVKLSGHCVDEAYDGIEAVKRLQDNSYDIVITDARMPGMDGVEVCKFLKSQFPDVYIVGMSGCSHALQELKDAGAHICLSKPFDMNEVEEVIKNRARSVSSDSDATSYRSGKEFASASV